MILVTGASGNVGSEVVTALRARGAAVRALFRDPAGAAGPGAAGGAGGLPAGVEAVGGDLSDPASLGDALAGVDGVFLLGGFPTLPDVLARARAAGVGHVALLTSRCVVGGKADNAITGMWLESEAAVRDSGLAWTVVRPSGFHSNALRWRPQLAVGDVVRAPWPDVRIASIDPADIAAVAAVALADRRHDGEALSLSGPAPLTIGEQVAALGRALGRPLRYEPQADAEARAEMAAAMPEPFVDAQFRFFSDGEYDDAVVLDTVARVTGRLPRTFEAWAAAHADRF
jgi:uncharacterized protein YbjT (DUF2867 family)